MIYKLNQTTQLGKMTDEMLEKIMENRKQEAKEKDKEYETDHKKQETEQKRNKQLSYDEITEAKNLKENQAPHEVEYNQLKKRDHSLALHILTQERDGLEEQIARYKAMMQAHEIGKDELSDAEVVSIHKVYEHLLVQRQKVDDQILKYDENKSQQHERDEEKERIIKMLVKKYSDTLE